MRQQTAFNVGAIQRRLKAPPPAGRIESTVSEHWDEECDRRGPLGVTSGLKRSQSGKSVPKTIADAIDFKPNSNSTEPPPAFAMAKASGATSPSITEFAAATQQETVFWQSVRDSADPGMFEAYLQSYPDGAFANIAELQRDALLEAEKPETQTDPVVPQMNLDLVFWESIKDGTNPADYEAYLQKHPDGEFAVLARSRIEAADQARSFASIGGNYNVEGRNPDGSTYSGNCRVSNIGDGSYSFNWSIGTQTFSGTGKLIGDTLSVDWGDNYPVIYKVAADGTLNGIWANGQAAETLHPKN